MVEVTVGREEVPDVPAALLHRGEDALRVVPGIHDDGVAARAVHDDAAVLLEGADDELGDREVHRAARYPGDGGTSS
ncbi:MAG: hypothetical protein U1E39_11945 [Planctomycetota bacterium]